MTEQTLATIQKSHLAYRPDIDGLRAMAIISVIVFHAFPTWLPGGFIGVDIFFVISGYLITTILLKAQSDGSFSLLDFYSRRIKRIFPTLIVVLSFCLSLGWFVLLADEYKALGKHIAAGASYISNFLLKSESGYFDISSEHKPLLHLWSLAIEEQFYLVWPLLLMLALRLKLNSFALIALAVTLSFLLNVVNIERLPTEVFYMPFTRSWELLVGAMVAYINLHKRAAFDQLVDRIFLSRRYSTTSAMPNVFSWSGLLLVGLAFLEVNKSKPFPGWWALLPTSGAALMILGGQKSWFNEHILASKLAVNVGLISYPLYLWHWPLLSFARIVEDGAPNNWMRLAVVLVSVFFAWATYWFVERNLRFRKHWGIPIGLFFVLALLGSIGYGVYKHEGYPLRYPKLEVLAHELTASEWERRGLNSQPACVEKFGKEFQQYCEINDISRAPTAVLIGDSTANHFFPGLAVAFAKNTGNLLNLGQGACTPLFGVSVTIQEGARNCERSIEKALNYAMGEPSVKTVLLSMMGVGYAIGSRSVIPTEQNFLRITYQSDLSLKKPLDVLDAAMRVTLHRLTASGKQVIFLMGVPMLDFDPASCVDIRPFRMTPAKLKSPCAMLEKDVDALSGDYQRMVKNVVKEFPQVKVWDPSQELCDGTYCWAMKDESPIYRDSVHLNESGSRFLGKRFELLDVPTNLKK